MNSFAHAGLMDRIYRYQRHIYDFTRKYYLLGRNQLIEELNVPVGGTVLEIGCGTGRNLIVAARRYPQAQFYGIDISEQMLQKARSNIAKAGLSDRIFVAAGDATNFDPDSQLEQPDFNRVFISYAVSMIPAWQSTIQNALRCVGAGGTLHIVDFGTLDRLPRWFSKTLLAWLALFHVTPRSELVQVLAEEAAVYNGRCSAESRFGGYTLSAIVGGLSKNKAELTTLPLSRESELAS